MSGGNEDSSRVRSSSESDEELKLGMHGIYADTADPFDDGGEIQCVETETDTDGESKNTESQSDSEKKDNENGNNTKTRTDNASIEMRKHDNKNFGPSPSQTGRDWELLRQTRQGEFETANALLSMEGYKPKPLVQDTNSRTAAHYAAMTSKGEETLKLIVKNVTNGTSYLTIGDYHLMTPLHYAAACYPSVKYFLDSLSNCEHHLIRRAETGDTVAHLAAVNRHTDGSNCILEIVNKVGLKCLQWQNSRKQTVLHLLAENGRSGVLKDLVERATNDESAKGCLTLCDEEGNMYFHYAVRNQFEGSKMVEAAISMPTNKQNPRLEHKNHKKQTVLQCAVISEWCDDNMTKQLIKEASPECRTHRDKFGNNALMYAVKNKKHKAAIKLLHCTDEDSWLAVNNERQTALHLAFRDSILTKHLKEHHLDVYNRLINCTTPDGLGRAYLFYACMGWNFEPVLDHLKTKQTIKENEPVLLRSIDIDGNTLLHALFLGSDANPSNKRDNLLSNFFCVFEKLLNWAVDPQKENDLGQNYLHASLLPEETLILVLNQLFDEGEPNMNKFKEDFKTVLNTSNGFHAIHSFASRYPLEIVQEPLAKLTGIPLPNLLRLAVTKGPLKGATCLHLACETDHKENIAFLTKEGLELAAETYAGLTCVDFANNVGKIEAIEATFSESNTDKEGKLEMLCLMDPPHRSLKLPQRTQARQLLAGVLDRPQGNKVLQGAKRTPHKSTLEDDSEASQSESKSSTMRTHILEKAMFLDSPAILRSGLRLKLVDRKSEASYCSNLQNKQASTDIQCSDKHEDKKEPPSTCSSNSHGQNKLEEYLRLGTFHESSEMLIVDAAFFLNKMELLPDLIVTRQFELIPVCLSLLVQLRPKIAEKIGHEQEALRELRDMVLGVAVTALNELFASAKEEGEVKLLMRYLRGKIEDRSGEKFNSGPRFPCRSDDQDVENDGSKRAGQDTSGGVKYLTIYQLAKKVDSEDLFATECFHHLIEERWTEQLTKFYFSAKLKFWIHLVAFIIFLVFYAWYLIEFRTTFQSPVSPVSPVLDGFMGAYLLSFTAQEAYQIWLGRRTRNFYWKKYNMQCPVYFQDGVNLLDCAAIIFMWIGLLWKWSFYNSVVDDQTTYTCQMILSTAFLLLGFRSVSFLSYFERIGPVISMMRSLLLKDLLPFAAIILVIFYSSGVFFFNLLFPVVASSEHIDSSYRLKVFLQVFTLPLKLFLTEPPEYNKANNTAGLNQTLGSVAHADGYGWFSEVLMFIFLILVNIVMVNLLIALFSLRVNTMVSKARCIWRRKYFLLMREFVTASPLPPPLSFAFYIIPLFNRIHVRKIKPAEPNLWWMTSGQSYPHGYVQYLKFQATNLRRVRPRLLRKLEQNRTDMEALKAYTGNSLSIMQRELEEALQKQEENLRKLEERQEAQRPSLQRSGSKAGDDRNYASALPEGNLLEANIQMQKMCQFEEKLDTLACKVDTLVRMLLESHRPTQEVPN